MRETILKKLAQWHTQYPWRMLTVVFLLTVLFAALAGRLTVTMRWSDLLPADDQRTVQFNTIIDEFVSATSLVVVVQGDEEQIKEFADDVAPRFLELKDGSHNDAHRKTIATLRRKMEKLQQKPGGEEKTVEMLSQIEYWENRVDMTLFRRVDYKLETGFLRDHGLMLLKEDNLKDIKDVFTDPNLEGILFNLNQAMEKEYVGQEESISSREKEDRAVGFLSGVERLIAALRRAAEDEEISTDEIHETADSLLFGEPYFLSYDKQALVLNVIPNFTMMDLDLLILGTNAAQEVLDEAVARYPGVSAGMTGFLAIGRDEMVYSEQSLGYTTLIAFIAILFLLMVSFRMWVAPLLAVANLLIGLVWAVGVTAVLVGQLNIMTQMMAVILLGLGIDFSIHLISGFTEWRAAGESIGRAMEKTFIKNGKGVVTGALTTACAFLTLIISHSRGMKEMGLVTGTGLICILLSTFLFLPSLLVLRERRLEKRRLRQSSVSAVPQRDIRFRFLGRSAAWFGKRWIFTLLSALGMTLIFLWMGSRITFDQNYMNIEPKGLTSILLQDVVMDKFDLSMDYAMVLVDDVEQSQRLSRDFRNMRSVASTEDISNYLPSIEEQRIRKPYIEQIRSSIQNARLRDGMSQGNLAVLGQEIERLEMNIMEMQDMAFIGGQDKIDLQCQRLVGDPENPESPNPVRDLVRLLESEPTTMSAGLSRFQNVLAPYFRDSVLQMASVDPFRLEELPDSLLDRYGNVDRDKFLVTVFPAGHIWEDAEFLKRFVTDLATVSDKATGMPPVFRALVEVIGRDGRNAVLLTIVVVFLLLWVDFRSLRYAAMAMIPLAGGIIWMVGLMRLTGMQLTIMNVMGLPMIIGIGIDDGVHIVHRLRQEGAENLSVIFSSTGKAILLTSLTTMLAFGSLVFSIWRGFAHLGGALFLGVGACFLTTVIILSGIIGGMQRRRNSRTGEKRTVS